MTTDPVTERYVSDRADLDLRSTLDLVELINDEDAKVAAAVRGASLSIAAAIDAIVGRLERGGRAVLVGAGPSGRLPLLDPAECALTVGVVCAAGSPLGALVEHEIAAVVGPEVLAGSTRMKAGTAQKLVLNTISTVSMVRLGKTYGNLMVDVVASNAKLRARARRAVELASGASERDAEAALEAAGGEVKVAIVSLLAGLDAARARSRLEANGGVLRRALEAAK